MVELTLIPGLHMIHMDHLGLHKQLFATYIEQRMGAISIAASYCNQHRLCIVHPEHITFLYILFTYPVDM